MDEGWEYVVQMDADFSHDPGDVPRLLAQLDQGADVAVGSRYVPGGGTVNWGLGRRLISHGGSLYARTILAVSGARSHGRLQGLEGSDAEDHLTR